MSDKVNPIGIAIATYIFDICRAGDLITLVKFAKCTPQTIAHINNNIHITLINILMRLLTLKGSD